MAGFDSDTLELIFGIALAAGAFMAMAMLLAWRVWRFFRRGHLLGGLICRTKLTWYLWGLTILPLLYAVVSVIAWRIFFLIRDLMGEFTGNTPVWLWIVPIAVTAFNVGFLVLCILNLTTRLEIRRRGLAACGTWDVSWDRVDRVVFPKRSAVIIEHGGGVSSKCCPKSERRKVAEALREAGVEVVDNPDYRCSGCTVFWTFFRTRTLWTAIAIGLAVFLVVAGGFYVSLAPEYAAAARLKETDVKVERVFFHVWWVTFKERTKPTEEQLRLLHEFPHLDWLDFSDTRLDDSVTGPLDGLTRLVTLDLAGTQIGDRTVTRLSGMRSLRSLYLLETPVTGEGFSAVEGLQKLESLNLRGTQLTPAGLDAISRLRSLQTLTLSETPVQDAWLAPLGSLSGLKTLCLEKTPVTDAGIKNLVESGKLQDLQNLFLSGTQITDGAAEALAQLKSLARLDLNETQVGDATVAALARHKVLCALSLAGTHITDASVDALKRMTHLAHLEIRDTDLSLEKAAEVANVLFEARVEWGEREEPEP